MNRLDKNYHSYQVYSVYGSILQISCQLNSVDIALECKLIISGNERESSIGGELSASRLSANHVTRCIQLRPMRAKEPERG